MLTIDEQPVETQEPEDLNDLNSRILYDNASCYSPFLKFFFHEVSFHEILLWRTFKDATRIRNIRVNHSDDSLL